MEAAIRNGSFSMLRLILNAFYSFRCSKSVANKVYVVNLQDLIEIYILKINWSEEVKPQPLYKHKLLCSVQLNYFNLYHSLSEIGKNMSTQGSFGTYRKATGIFN